MSSEVVQFIAVPGKGQSSTAPGAKPAAKPKPPAKKAASNAGRKTDKERLERELELEELRRRVEQEKGRAIRRQPDTKVVLNVAYALTGVSFATAFIISYATMAATAEWMRLPWEWLAWAVPGFVEVLIVFCAIDYVVQMSRGATRDARTPFVAQWVLASVAALANGAHTISEWGADWGVVNWQSLIGTVLSVAAPLVVVYTSKRLAKLVFVDPEAA